MHEIPQLSRKGLRDFAFVTSAIVAGLFGVVLPWLFGLQFPMWPWALAAALAMWGLLAPNTLQPVYKGWMRFGLLLSKITTPLIMGGVFLTAIAPMAIFLRIARWDAMRRQLDPSAESYRVESKQPARDNLEKPY